MRILDFIPYYRPHIGGMEKFAEELHRELIALGDEIIVFTPDLPPSKRFEETTGLTIIRYPAFELIPNYPLPKFWSREYRELRRDLEKARYDIVMSTARFFFQAIMAHLFAKKHGLKRIHIEHGSGHISHTWLVSLFAYLYDMTLGKIALRGADQVVTPSVSAARFVRTLTGSTPPVIYRGLPFSLDADLPRNEKIRRQYAGKYIVTYLGRLIYGKGVSVLLQAVKELERDDFILLIVGDGPEMASLKNQAERQGLLSQVRFLGSKPFNESMGILKASDIFVNPSFMEGLPTSVLEAAACKTAIVATDVGGTKEIVTDGDSALIIPHNNVAALTRALEKALDDQSLRERLRTNAYGEIQQRFDWKKNALAYQKILSEATHHAS